MMIVNMASGPSRQAGLLMSAARTVLNVEHAETAEIFTCQ